MRWSEFGLHLRIRFTPQPSLLQFTIGPFNSPSTDILFNTTKKKKEAVTE
jgi:hypothetical protein